MTWHYTATARPGTFYGPFSHAHPSSTWILQLTILLLLSFVMSCPQWLKGIFSSALIENLEHWWVDGQFLHSSLPIPIEYDLTLDRTKPVVSFVLWSTSSNGIVIAALLFNCRAPSPPLQRLVSALPPETERRRRHLLYRLASPTTGKRHRLRHKVILSCFYYSWLTN